MRFWPLLVLLAGCTELPDPVDVEGSIQPGECDGPCSHLHTIQIQDPVTINATLTWTPADTDLDLFLLQDGEPVTASAQISGTFETFGMPLRPGTYHLEVYDVGGDPADYHLRAEFTATRNPP